jgi:hypothetical protein
MSKTASAPRLIVQKTLVEAPIAPVRKPRRKAPPGPLGVVEQVRAALHPKARLATLLGALLGGFVPVATYLLAHHEAVSEDRLHAGLAALLVLGGLCFSAKTVYAWGHLAFQSGGKSLGFVVLMEGTMVVSREPRLGLAALAYLVGINAIATGCTLSVKRQPAPSDGG